MATLAFTAPDLSSQPHPAPVGTRRRRLANRLLEQAWASGAASVPSLDPAHLVAAATARVRSDALEDAGPWRTNLDVLAAALEAEAGLSALGRTIAHGQIVAALADRARLSALWRRHPEIAEQPLAAPIIVLGQMRSGTTRMQRLLACDPRLAHTRLFESLNPVPTGAIDDRRLRAILGLGLARLLNPSFAAIHPTGASAPDEEAGFHSISLYGATFEAQWRVPAFARHCEALEPSPVYAEFRRLMQTVAWLRGAPARPWVLKLPQMMQDLPAVLATFPDARLVCLHRDATATVASSASLVLNQMALQCDAPDPHWIGREWLHKAVLRHGRAAAARAAAAHVPQVEVHFSDMNRDWRGEMRRVYAMLGLPLTAAVERRMAAYVARAARAPLHHHRYSLDAFGLTEAGVNAAFA
ncbi:sulfotransferase family protein [Sphingomonas jatrophae]|nr:sulfotransferase [Sphingomonas jatrophae]